MTTADFKTQLRRSVRDTNSNKYMFTNDEITDATTGAVDSLWPHTWAETIEDVVITDLNKNAITLVTSGFVRLDKVYLMDSDGDYIGEYKSYYRVGSTIYPTFSEFPTGYTFRFFISKKFTTIEECPDEYSNYLLAQAKIALYEFIESDRSRLYKYTTSIKPEGGNLPSIDRIITRLEKNCKDALQKIARVRPPAMMDLTG